MGILIANKLKFGSKIDSRILEKKERNYSRVVRNRRYLWGCVSKDE